MLDADRPDRSQEYAAAALAELAHIPANKVAIDRGGGIQPLVAVLCDSHQRHASKRFAAAALARLSVEHKRKTRGQRARDVPEEVELKPKVSKAETIAEAGAIGPLVGLLNGDKGSEAQEEAAGALVALAENEGNRMGITEAGGIGPLVLLLGCTNDKAREHAEGALVRLSIETSNRKIIITQLVGMLDQERGIAAQEQAAAALANLAKESTENRTSILAADGVPRLLALLQSTSAKAKENAVSAISQLAHKSFARQEVITKANGIPMLVATLQSASLNVKEASGVKLCELTTLAIWNMSDENKENQTALMKEGAIPGIVGMVTNPAPEMQTNAAGALSCLAKDHPDNQAAIARSGAIPPLCTNVRDGTPETREESAAAIWALATDNAPNKATIAKLGGIEPLVSMLMYGSTDKSSQNAAGALAALATQHSDNRLTITKRMVSVLGSKAPPTRAVRLLSALASLCENENTNQVAIAKSGGIQHLITWLGNTSEEVQVQAAKAMLSVAGNNSTTQSLIGKLGGVPPLVNLVQRGVQEAQEHAACALWHLATLSENRVIITASNGIPHLVSMLVGESSVSAQLAAMLLLRLAEGSSKAATAISQAGGTKPLVSLISTGSPASQQMCAAVIAAIGLIPCNRDAIANSNAVKPLVRLICDKTLGTPETAARALAHLAREDDMHIEVREAADGEIPKKEEKSGGSFREAPSIVETKGNDKDNTSKGGGEESDNTDVDSDDEGVNYCTGADQRRMLIKQAGGTHMLIQMLDGSNLNPSEPFKPATVGGWGAVKVGTIGCVEVETIFIGSDVDFGMRIGMQEQAAATLADLAVNDTDMQNAIVSEKGIPPLLSLIRSGSQQAQEHAAATVWYLAAEAHNQKAVVASHAIIDLVALLKSGSPKAQYFSAAALSQLASGAVQQRRDQLELRTAEMTNMRSNRRRSVNLDRRIAAATAALMQDAEDEDGEDETGADIITLTEPGVPRTNTLEEEGTDSQPSKEAERYAKIDAESTLLAKIAKNPNAQLPALGGHGSGVDVLLIIGEQGGIAPLVKLCEMGTPEGKEQAASALWYLAAETENQASIAVNGGIKPLVSLLADGNPQALIHASNALTRLATDNQENQAQIAKRLVGLLDHDDASVVSRAAHDLQALAEDHQGAPMVIVNAGAISPLVTVLSNGKTDEGRNEAAKTLHTLANSGRKNQVAIAVGLVALLGVGTDQAQEYVTQLLLTLSGGATAGDQNNRKAIANAGPFKMLVQQLRSESARVRMLAAAVMAKLSGDSAENVKEIAKASGISPLVALLGAEHDLETQMHATAVLADMMRWAPEYALGVAQEGGTPMLVGFLVSDHTVEAKAQVAAALASIARDHADEVGGSGAIVPLIKLLQMESQTAQQEAALALAGIALGGPANQDSIREAGGTEILVRLLSDSLPSVEGSLSDPDKVALQSNCAKSLAALGKDHESNQDYIRECGGLRPLITLLDTSTATDQPKEEASWALWTLSSGNTVSQDAIAAANGVDSLVHLISVTSARGQEQASGALASLALNNEANRTNIASLLVSNLGSSSALLDTQEKAARALSRFAQANPSNQDALAAAGGIKLVVSLLDPRKYELPAASKSKGLKTGEEENREEAEVEPKRTGEHHLTQTELCAALWSLSTDNSSNQMSIAEEGGLPKLIALLSDNPEIHRDAAGALWSLSKDSTNQRLIAEAEGIPRLSDLLKYGAKNVSAQETAAGALHSLASRPENRDIISSAGSIDVLIPLFDGGSAETKQEVTGALLALSVENPQNQFTIAHKLVKLLENGPQDAQEAMTSAQMSRVEAQEYATRVLYMMSLERDYRDALSRAGAIIQLTRQLKSGSEKAQGLASSSLTQIARMSPELRVQVTQQLVTLLSSSNADVRQRAGNALRDNSADGGDDSKNQREAVMSGGVGPLVDLLKAGLADDRVEAQEYSLWSLSMISDATRRRQMAEDNIIASLIQSLRGGKLSPDSEEHACLVLACLLQDPPTHEDVLENKGISMMVAVITGIDKTLGAKKQAALGLSRLALHSTHTQERMFKAGAIVPLVQWLYGASGPPEVAARALEAMARGNCQLQVQIAEDGAIPPLVAMLKPSNDAEMHVAAADTIATLTNGVASNQLAVAEVGGIPLLVALLVKSRIDCQENASKALSTLAEHEDNKMLILSSGGIGPLVHLLRAGNAATQQHTAKALELLASCMVEIQAAIAHEGASQPLTDLLGSESMETQESAAQALLCLASHPDSRVVVVRRLVGVLSGRNTAAQLKAADALSVLASRSALFRSTIVQAGAISPLIELMGNGQRADLHTPPERAAAVLANLAKVSESKVEVANAGGIGPLVTMLCSPCQESQTHACAALRYLSVSAENKVQIAHCGAIPKLVIILVDGTLDGQRHAAHALWQLATTADNRTAIVMAGGIAPLVALVRKGEIGEDATKDDMKCIAETNESAAAVLSELARSQSYNRMAIVEEDGIEPLVELIIMGSTGAQKHATCALWGLAQEARYRHMIVETQGTVERLVELLRDFEGETQGFAAATVVCLAQDETGKAAIRRVGGPGPLMTIALGPANWLRTQCVEALKLLGYSDPTENRGAAVGSPPTSPRLARYHAELAANPAIWMVDDEPVKMPINDEHMADLAKRMRIADRVLVMPGARRAEVRYIGKVPEIAPGYWIGVVYDEAVGKNDGSIKGRRCFDCVAEYGGIMRPDHIQPDLDPPTRKARTKEESEMLETAAAKAAMQAESTVSGDGRRKRSSPPRTPQDPDSARGKGGKGKASKVAESKGMKAESKPPIKDKISGELVMAPRSSSSTPRDKTPRDKKDGLTPRERKDRAKSPSPRAVTTPRVSSPSPRGSSPRASPRADEQPLGAAPRRAKQRSR